MSNTSTQPSFATARREGKTVITRNGHTMFTEDVVKELLALQAQNANLRARLAALEVQQSDA